MEEVKLHSGLGNLGGPFLTVKERKLKGLTMSQCKRPGLNSQEQEKSQFCSRKIKVMFLQCIRIKKTEKSLNQG